jgi:lysophospholipase L1-like esterase
MRTALTLAVIVLGAFVLFVIVEGIRLARAIYLAIQLGKKTVPFSQESRRGGKRALVIGDSTSYGTGTSDPRYSLAGRLAADLPDYTIENQSENAMSLARLAEKLETLHGPYDRIYIHIGGVDSVSFTPLGKMRAKLDTVLKRAHALTNGPIYLVSVNNPRAAPAYGFPFSRVFEWRSRKVSTTCGEACSLHNVYHIPLWHDLEHEPLLTTTKSLFAQDGMHPNDEGYGVWYQKIKEAL